MPSTIPHVIDMTNPQVRAQEPPPPPLAKETATSAASIGDTTPSTGAGRSLKSVWAHKYRGATVEDLDPPPALSANPSTPISGALMSAYERDYTHLTVVDSNDRALIGYLSIPRLKELLKDGVVKESDPVERAMQKFRRRKGVYRTITMDTSLEELEDFFRGGVGDASTVSSSDPSAAESASGNEWKQDFAVVTDWGRRFVLGVATRGDLEEFVKRRPG